ncbi:MAG: hypothetical protein HFE58_11020 [Firmicutes bacterium]|nr:hypothetical protein [Bacillota bacterium]
MDYTYNACKPEVKNKIISMTLNGSGIRRYLKGIKDKYHNRNELHKKIKIYKICKY